MADAGVRAVDAGSSSPDAGDAGRAPDSGTDAGDDGGAGFDAGLLTRDAGAPDAGRPDAGWMVLFADGGLTYIKASNTRDRAAFGQSIALSADGTTMAVGAFAESSNGRGPYANQTGDGGFGSGAVYIFHFGAGGWTQQAFIKATNAVWGAWFGISVALSADGDTLIVGSTGESSDADGGPPNSLTSKSGAAYIFTRNANVWSQQAYLKASNPGYSDQFGMTVAVSGDGNIVLVAAPFEDGSGTGINPQYADEYAQNSGAAYLFSRTGSSWAQLGYVKASNTTAAAQFGNSLAIDQTGDTFAVGSAQEEGQSTGVNGNQLAKGVTASGAVYVFRRAGQTWSQEAYVKASNTASESYFGTAISLSNDGAMLAVGSPMEASAARGVNGRRNGPQQLLSGAAYVFTRTGSTWTQEAHIKAATPGFDQRFGARLTLAGSRNAMLVSEPQESSDPGAPDGGFSSTFLWSGAVHLFRRGDAGWEASDLMKAVNARSQGGFGSSLAISHDGRSFAIGQNLDESSATGLNGDPFDNLAPTSGCVFFYRQ